MIKNIIFFMVVIVMITTVSKATAAESYNQIGVPTKETPYDERYEGVKKYLWTSLEVDEQPKATEMEKVKEYLEKASRFKHKSDPPDADRWQLPFETEMFAKGDCEDKAIWLYSKLLNVGLDVRLVLGNYDMSKRSVHMWVNWYHNDDVYLLDPTIYNGIRRTEEYSKDFYKPYYSFCKDKKWKHKI